MGRVKFAEKNIAFGYIGQMATALMSFVLRTIFIAHLSKELLGINSTYTNVLSILSMAELGIGTALNFALYAPVAQNNTGKIKSYMQMYRKAYTVIALIVAKKPTIPTFVAGIVAGALIAMFVQGASIDKIMSVMYSGYKGASGSKVVDSMLNRGGFNSMMSTVALLIAAAIFGAPLRTAGVVDVLLNFVRKVSRSSRVMSLGVLALHSLFFCITGAYYVTYPVVGSMTKDLYPEYGLDKKNLMRGMLDTGTGLAPLVPWSTTGSYTATTLGVANAEFAAFAPRLWGSIVLSVIYAATGLCTAKLKKEEA